MNIEEFRKTLNQSTMYKVNSEHYSHALPKDMSDKDLTKLLEQRMTRGVASLLVESIPQEGYMRLVD